MIISFCPTVKHIKHYKSLNNFANLVSWGAVVWQRRMSLCVKLFNSVLILCFRVTLKPDAEIHLSVAVFIDIRVKFQLQ